jgi:Flp pilus assembly protein TadG
MKLKRNICLKNNDGAVVVIVAISLTAIMMVTALSIDVGSLYTERRHLQTVADSAVLAGAQELPENPNNAIIKAYEYANIHGVTPDNLDVAITDTLTTNDTIVVTSKNPASPLYFARVMGRDSSEVVATATAIIAKPLETGHMVPWTVDKEIFDTIGFGEETSLIFDSPHTPGNFSALDLGGSGAKDYAYYIKYGYDGELGIGSLVDTEPGDMGNKEIKAVRDRVEVLGDGWQDFEKIVDLETKSVVKTPETQVVIVPIISFEEVNGGKGKDIPILDFGIFVITKIDYGDKPGNPPGQATIVGAFVKNYLIQSSGEILPVDEEGLRVIRLIK